MDNLERCDYCSLLLQHIGILQDEFNQSDPDIRYATILELKSYCWLIKEYYNKVLIHCECEDKIICYSILENLLSLFKQNDVKLGADKMKCDICRVLPCEVFSLLDILCKISDQEGLDSMNAELQYHVFLSWIYNHLLGQCTDCDAFVDLSACIQSTCEYLNDNNIHKLKEFVYYWKKATNSDNILGCIDSLNMSRNIKSSTVKLDNHVMIYLDFNVYNQYEKNSKVTEFFKKMLHQENISVIYSGTHLEEIMRMNNKKYELIRIQSIQELTHGKIAVIGASNKIEICVEDILARMNQVKRYHTMNNFAEERECIEAEAREHLSLLEYNE